LLKGKGDKEKEFGTAGIKISLGISYTIPSGCHILQPDLLFLMWLNNTGIIPTSCKKTYEKYKHSPTTHSNSTLSMGPKY